MRDFLDRKILVGDTVVYPHRARSVMVLKKAVVNALGALTVHCTNENGRNIVIQHPERSVSLPPAPIAPPPPGSFTMTRSKE